MQNKMGCFGNGFENLPAAGVREKSFTVDSDAPSANEKITAEHLKSKWQFSREFLVLILCL